MKLRFAKSRIEEIKNNRMIALCGLKTWLLLTALSFVAFASYGATITIDFQKLYTEESPEDITAAQLLKFLNSEDGSPGIVSAVPECNLAYGYSDGLFYNGPYKKASSSLVNKGALFLKSTDAETHEDVGVLSLSIAPEYRHRNTNVWIYVYLDDKDCTDDDLDHGLEISVNGGTYTKSNIVKIGTSGFIGRYNYKPEGSIIKDLSIRVPNAYRSVGEPNTDYFMALTYINLYYSDSETSEQVTDWRFAQGSDISYLDDATPYSMPEFVALPAEAGDMMELSSSNPQVAAIENGKIVPKKEGVTTITATLPENNLFTPTASYSPASYELTVKKSMSTGVETFIPIVLSL